MPTHALARPSAAPASLRPFCVTLRQPGLCQKLTILATSSMEAMMTASGLADTFPVAFTVSPMSRGAL